MDPLVRFWQIRVATWHDIPASSSIAVTCYNFDTVTPFVKISRLDRDKDKVFKDFAVTSYMLICMFPKKIRGIQDSIALIEIFALTLSVVDKIAKYLYSFTLYS